MKRTYSVVVLIKKFNKAKCVFGCLGPQGERGESGPPGPAGERGNEKDFERKKKKNMGKMGNWLFLLIFCSQPNNWSIR